MKQIKNACSGAYSGNIPSLEPDDEAVYIGPTGAFLHPPKSVFRSDLNFTNMIQPINLMIRNLHHSQRLYISACRFFEVF